jgi:predicted transcriptional regulator of viral defense system
MSERRVSDWVDERQSQGRYSFTWSQVQTGLDLGRGALEAALRRLKESGRLVSPYQQFYVIVPLEYRRTGAPPPSWYVDDLMGAMRRSYYVGLLSAASLHGSAHQRPQEFQVVTDRSVRARTVGRARLRFFVRGNLGEAAVERRKTETGYMRVSTAEQTALDLLRYVYACGHLDNVAAVLDGLAPELDAARLVEVAPNTETADVQRLGYLLDELGHADRVEPLRRWLEERGSSRVPLRRGGARDASLLDRSWRVYVNSDVTTAR